jgi:hypothetical protein
MTIPLNERGNQSSQVCLLSLMILSTRFAGQVGAFREVSWVSPLALFQVCGNPPVTGRSRRWARRARGHPWHGAAS